MRIECSRLATRNWQLATRSSFTLGAWLCWRWRGEIGYLGIRLLVIGHWRGQANRSAMAGVRQERDLEVEKEIELIGQQAMRDCGFLNERKRRRPGSRMNE